MLTRRLPSTLRVLPVGLSGVLPRHPECPAIGTVRPASELSMLILGGVGGKPATYLLDRTRPRSPCVPDRFASLRAAICRLGRQDWRLIGRIAGVSTLVLAVVALAAGAGLWWYADRQIQREALPNVADERARGAAGHESGSTAAAPPPLEGVTNVLAVGTDSREGLTEQQLLELGTEPVEGQRADSVILVQLSPQRSGAVMLSFPRDLRVLIPGRGAGKLNAALAHGGPDLLVEAVESFTGVSIDHYVQVDIAGFLEIVDIVGGVPVCLDEPLVDPAAGADIPAGRQVLTGTQAAAYVRSRRADPRGDLARIERQQGFLRQAMRRALSLGTFVNPVRTKRLVDAVAGAVLTDEGFSTSHMARVAWSLRDLDPASVDMRTVPAEPERIDATSYMVADPEEAETVFHALRAGAALPEPPATTPDAGGDAGLVPAESVRVHVLNGAGVQRLAAQAEKQLGARGFEIAGTGNADAFGVGRTEVRYAPGHKRAALAVARHFRDAAIVPAEAPIPQDADVAVVVGDVWAEEPELVQDSRTSPAPAPATPATGECV